MIRIRDCPGCGASVSSENKYCPFCGIRLLSEDDPSGKEPEHNHCVSISGRPTDGTSVFYEGYREIREIRRIPPKKRRKGGRLIAGILVMAIIAVMASVLLPGFSGAIADKFGELVSGGEQEISVPSPAPTFFETIATPDFSNAVASLPSPATTPPTVQPSPTSNPATPTPALPVITPTPDPYAGSYGDIDYPAIEMGGEDPDYTAISHAFRFRDFDPEIVLQVDRNLYEAARDADKKVYYYDYVPESVWSAGLYRAMITDPELDEFYDTLLSSLRSLKNEFALDSDGYAEMIVAYVQSIPYKTDNINTDPKYPVETVYGNKGDCDDKSMLLAALLAHEGYDVALFSFDSEEHMTAAIRSEECSYRGTGYAIIETTDYCFIGWKEILLDGGKQLYNVPQVIKIGTGATPYYAGDQVIYIYKIYSELESEIELLYDQFLQHQSLVNEIYSELTSMGEEMDLLMDSGDTDGFNSLVPQYNALVDSYNREGRVLNDMADNYNHHLSLLNAINDRPYDREGVYELAVSI